MSRLRTPLLCAAFFLSGYCWGKCDRFVITKLFKNDKSATNISYYLGNNSLLELNSNKSFSIDSILVEKKTILVFWSPNCPYSEKLFSNLNLLNDNINILGFPIDFKYNELKQYLAKNSIIHRQFFLINDEGKSQNYPDISTIPTVFIVDNIGHILHTQVGSKLNSSFFEAMNR